MLLPLFLLTLAPMTLGSVEVGACDTEFGHHAEGLVVQCDAAIYYATIVAGDHQSARCEENRENLIVIIGDYNHVSC